MSIHNNILHVIIIEQVIPIDECEVEGIMENKFESRLLLTHHVSHISVESLQSVKVRVPPRFVNRFDSI